MTPRSKYKFGNTKVIADEQKFDSLKELRRYRQLQMMMQAAHPNIKVVKIERQVPYTFCIGGKKIFTYKADYRVTYASGRVEVEDVKALTKDGKMAYRDDAFKLKKKIIEAEYGIEIKLV